MTPSLPVDATTSSGNTRPPRLSQASARRAALAAQGFTDRRPTGTPTRRHLARVLSRTRLLQLDSVNVAVRAHYVPLFSRLGPYPAVLLESAAWAHSARKPRQLVEYWAHEACLLPVADWPLLRWRMREFGGGWRTRYRRLLDDEPGLVDDVLAGVKDLGPVGAGRLETELGGGAKRGSGPWWNRSDTKRACELLFATGQLTTGTRRGFERCYDLPERVLPADVLGSPEIPEPDAVRELVRRSAEALGIATEPDLRDYYRLRPAQSQRAVAELVEAGDLEPVEVVGWRHRAYRMPGMAPPRRVRARALLCPFDPLIWDRARTERLFNFRYRIEIYTPAHQRVYGYYVFPFLLDETLVGRVDLKADRSAGALRVLAAYAEPEVDVPRVATELGEELRSLAGWLGLETVIVGERGDLAEPLRARVGRLVGAVPG